MLPVEFRLHALKLHFLHCFPIIVVIFCDATIMPLVDDMCMTYHVNIVKLYVMCFYLYVNVIKFHKIPKL